MQKVFNVAVDIGRKLPAPAFEVNTNDLKSVKLLITITNGQTLLDLTDTTVRIAIRKPDNNIIFQDCTIKDEKNGQVEIVLENQAYITAGTHTAEIMCYKGNDVVAVSGTFSYKSTKGIMNDEAVESKSEFTVINQKIEEARKLLEDAAESGVGVDEQARQEIQQVTAKLADTAKKSEVQSLVANKAEKTFVDNALSQKRDKNSPIGLNDATPELLAAIEGGEGTSFNLLSIPRKGSVDPTKTTFMTTGKNFFNKDTVELGFALSSNGALVAQSGSFTSGFMSANPNQVYTRAKDGYRTAFYDEAGNFISQVVTKSFTTPSNCSQLKISGTVGILETEQVEEGNASTSYESYKIEITKLKITEDVKKLETQTTALNERVAKSENGIRALKRNPINPSIGEMWLYLSPENILANGGFENGDTSNWGVEISGNPTRIAKVSNESGDFVAEDGNYGYKLVLTSHEAGNTGHILSRVIRKSEVDLNKLTDFSLRYKIVSSETSEQNPLATSNAVFVRLQFTVYENATSTTLINDVSDHKNEIYLFGASQYTNAIKKQSNTVMDKWNTLELNLKEIISSRLLAGYTWDNVGRIELKTYTYAATSAGVNKIGVRFDSFMAVGD